MPIVQTELDKEYLSIEANDYHEKLRFYDQNIELIAHLPSREQYFYTYEYVCALREVGHYETVLAEIDQIIEYTIVEGVDVDGPKTFEKLLFLKAVAHHELFECQEAMEVAEQLVVLSGYNAFYGDLLCRIYFRRRKMDSFWLKTLSIILIIGSTIATGILWLMPQFSDWDPITSQAYVLAICPCLIALLLLGGCEYYNYILSRRRLNQLYRETSRSS